MAWTNFIPTIITLICCFFISSCSTIIDEDPCNGVNCQNGGDCIDGSCLCPTGFEGKFCETKIIKNCNYTPFSGSVSCSAGYIPVASGTCCPETHPFHCPLTGSCFTTCEAAANAGCSGNVVKGGANTPGGGGGGGGAGTGKAFFWANRDCGCGNINVSIDGVYVGQTSYPFSGITPMCGESGFLTKTLSVGSHSFNAECSTSKWNGNFTITANTCTPQELTCSTTGTITFWTKLNQQISVALVTTDLGCATSAHANEEVIKTTHYYSSSPSKCGADGCATFFRPEGRFTYTASTAGKSWSGCVTISTGCLLFELK